MKLIIDPKYIEYFKNNFIYIISLIIFIILGIFFIPKQLSEINLQNNDIEVLNNEISQKEKQLSDIELFPNEDPILKIALIDKYLPQSEDYFSIFTSIDILSQKSGIIVESHTSPYGKSANGITSLTLQGIGTYNSLMYLLTKYHYLSGRLMTINSVKYLPQINSFSIGLQFYTADKNKVSPNKPNVQLINLYNNISQENAGFDLSTQKEKINTDYSIKNNPFLR